MADQAMHAAGGPEPTVERPTMPDGYGVPDTLEGALPWSWAVERLASARNMWFSTTRPDGRPHAVPAWGMWLDGGGYFEGSPETLRARMAREAAEMLRRHVDQGLPAQIGRRRY